MARVCEGDVAPVFFDIPKYLERWRDRLHDRDPASRVEVPDLLWRRFSTVCRRFEITTREEEAEAFLVGAVRDRGGLEELRCRISRDVTMHPSRAPKDLVLWTSSSGAGPWPPARVQVLGLLRSLVEPYVQLVAGEYDAGDCLLRQVPVLGFVPMDADLCADAAWWIVAQLPQAPPQLYSLRTTRRAAVSPATSPSRARGVR